MICNLGTSNNISGSISSSDCIPCPIGKYSSNSSFSCDFCAAGTYSDIVGSSYCNTCPTDYFSVTGATECSSFPSFKKIAIGNNYSTSINVSSFWLYATSPFLTRTVVIVTAGNLEFSIPNTDLSYSYDLDKASWTRHTSVASRTDAAFLSSENHAFYAGGISGTVTVSNFDIFHVSTNTWQTNVFLSSRKYSLGSVYVNKLAIFMCGSFRLGTTIEASGSLEVFNVTSFSFVKEIQVSSRFDFSFIIIYIFDT